MNSVVSISVTNKKLGEAADGTGTEVGTCLINQEGLYNVKVNAPRKGLGKMAKNQSLLACLQEKDSSSEHGLILYEHHEKPPSGDQGLAFQTHALQMILIGPFYVRTQYYYGSS